MKADFIQDPGAGLQFDVDRFQTRPMAAISSPCPQLLLPADCLSGRLVRAQPTGQAPACLLAWQYRVRNQAAVKNH